MTEPLQRHPTPAGDARGRRGAIRLERVLRALRDAGRIEDYLQPDAIVLVGGGAFMVEAKDQDHFEAPPFDGHGLPVTQAGKYEGVRAAVGMRTWFVVYDNGNVYAAWLDELEAVEHFDTAGIVKTPRRIYPLSSFRRLG
jgi:hypothetical protein